MVYLGRCPGKLEGEWKMSRKGRKLTQVHHGGSGEAAESQSCWGIRLWGAGREGQWGCGTPIGRWPRLLPGRQLPGTPAEKVSHDCILAPGQKPCHPTQPPHLREPHQREEKLWEPLGFLSAARKLLSANS